MLTRIFATVFSVVLFVFVVYAGAVQQGSLTARSDGNDITVRWLSEDEAGVAQFVIERQSGFNGVFVTLVELSPKGNGSTYEFVDHNAFRMTESIYKYRVKVVFANGASPAYFGPITVSHKTSDVRRTWGSIKAMFR
jgi:hypothetical protein